MVNKLKEIVTGLAIATSLVCGSPNHVNAEGTIEVMAADESTILDNKVKTELATRTNLFLRNITSTDYRGEVDYFGLVDLSLGIINGLDAVAEVQFIPEVGIIPRIGAQYFNEIDQFSVYALATAGLNDGDVDAEFIANLRYVPKITDELSFVLNLENVTNVGEQGHNFSLQKLRAGLGIDKYEIGAAADFLEANGEITSNLGGYALTKF